MNGASLKEPIERVIGRILVFFREGVSAGVFRHLSPRHFFQTLLGATVFHYAARNFVRPSWAWTTSSPTARSLGAARSFESSWHTASCRPVRVHRALHRADPGVAVGRLAASFGEAKLVTAGLMLMGVSMFGVAAAPSYRYLLVVGPVVALGNGIAFPSFTSLYSRVCHAEKAGEFLGESQSMATAGRIVGPIWAGLALGAISVAAPFWIAGVLMIAAAGIFYVLQHELLEDLG